MNGALINYPTHGTLQVQTLLISRDGGVIDFGGVVIPDPGGESPLPPLHRPVMLTKGHS